jgi:osmotically-inducible protein OsmY
MKQFNAKLWISAVILSVCLGFTACKGKTSDSAIQASFNEKVKSDSRLTNISATVNDGVVTLNGQCPDEACRTSAEQTAKDVKGVKSVVNNITVTPPPAPVEVNTDAALQAGVTDAVKDYPGVTATVTNGEVTLNGAIERSRLPKLMQAIHALSPKKVNNNLTVK